MRSFRIFPVVLSFAALPATPIAARTMIVQYGQVGQDRTTSEEYQDRYEQERRERRRKEQEALHEQDSLACEIGNLRGCGDYEGIQTRGIPDTRLVAVIHQATREDGVLTVRFRFYNEGSDSARLTIDPSNAYESFFASVAGEKLFILKDEDGELEAKDPLEVDLKPGKMESWWASFPAPAADAKTFDLEIPPIAPFQDVPISDD